MSEWLAGRIPRRRIGPRCPSCGGALHIVADSASYAYLLGLYLGDGYIAPHPRGVFRLRIVLDARYPEIIRACAAAVQAAVPDNKVSQLRRQGCVEVRAYSKGWPCLLPHVGPGKKHEREVALQPWQHEHVDDHAMDLLRGLIHSDGCRFINTGRGRWMNPRYSFSNRSADIRRIFCEACDDLGVEWTTSGTTVYVSRKADVARLDEFIGPKR